MGVVVVVGLNLYDCRGGEFGVDGGEDRLQVVDLGYKWWLIQVVGVAVGGGYGFGGGGGFYCRDGAKTKT